MTQIVSQSNTYRTETEDPALSAAHAEGWQAFMVGKPKSFNPYTLRNDTSLRDLWFEGWEDAEQFEQSAYNGGACSHYEERDAQ